jgi:hypothetical protein
MTIKQLELTLLQLSRETDDLFSAVQRATRGQLKFLKMEKEQIDRRERTRNKTAFKPSHL